MDLCFTFTLATPEAMQRLGQFMGQHHSQAPCIWLLDGEMGSGKTTFTQGVAMGLGLQEYITSPTFTLVNEYLLPSQQKLYHFDWYRLATIEDLFELGIDEYLNTPEALLVIEWANRFPDFFTDNTLRYHFSHAQGARQVKLEIPSAFNKLYDMLQTKAGSDHVCE